MTYALVTDVATEIGRPITSPEEVEQVNQWISFVEAMIRARLGADRFNALDADVAKLVVTAAVGRRVKNPDGKYQERIDDYSYSLTTDAAKAGLYITAEEWELLSPATATGAFTIRPGGAPYGQYAWLTGDWWRPL